jgi:hypothetical protein
MPAVTARVRERVDRASVVSGQQHAPGADPLGALVAGVRDLVAATHAQPAAAEEVLKLPLEHSLIHVGGAGEHPALAERAQRLSERCWVERSERWRRAQILTDHTVKNKWEVKVCPDPGKPSGAFGRPSRLETPLGAFGSLD